MLGRFIPDFGRIVAMMQFNMYHHYTVDEHLIRAVGVLAEIDAGRLGEDHPLATEIMPHDPATARALYVALLLHDIAKGRPEDHSHRRRRDRARSSARASGSTAGRDRDAWPGWSSITW